MFSFSQCSIITTSIAQLFSCLEIDLHAYQICYPTNQSLRAVAKSIHVGCVMMKRKCIHSIVLRCAKLNAPSVEPDKRYCIFFFQNNKTYEMYPYIV